MSRFQVNLFEELSKAGLASQVLSLVLNKTVSFYCVSDRPYVPATTVIYWQVESHFEYLVALFIWQQEREDYGGLVRPQWASKALSEWEEWRRDATQCEYSAIEAKVAAVFNNFRGDVAKAKVAGYHFCEDTCRWVQQGSRDNYKVPFTARN